jgi:hypothetical protein
VIASGGPAKNMEMETVGRAVSVAGMEAAAVLAD